MKIKDELLNPFFIETDYNGARLYKEDNENKSLGHFKNISEAIAEIGHRQIAAIDATVTIKEYIQKTNTIMNALSNSLKLEAN